MKLILEMLMIIFTCIPVNWFFIKVASYVQNENKSFKEFAEHYNTKLTTQNDDREMEIVAALVLTIFSPLLLLIGIGATCKNSISAYQEYQQRKNQDTFRKIGRVNEIKSIRL